MTSHAAFDAAFARMPLVAILRGIVPHEAVEIGDVLAEAGFSLMEVPLNSPSALESISRMAARVGRHVVVGAGTVLTPAEVEGVYSAGGSMIVSPNTNVAVLMAAAKHGLASLPGVATPSEAFVALGAGAAALKLFPAEASSPVVLKAMRAVLPAGTRVLPVGGITPAALPSWHAAGAAGFGLGSAVYKPGDSPAEVGGRARAFVEAWKALHPAHPG